LRLAAMKQTTHRFHTEMFHLKKWNDVEDKVRYCFEIFAALETLDADVFFYINFPIYMQSVYIH
jgi:hypothetical protein